MAGDNVIKLFDTQITAGQQVLQTVYTAAAGSYVYIRTIQFGSVSGSGQIENYQRVAIVSGGVTMTVYYYNSQQFVSGGTIPIGLTLSPGDSLQIAISNSGQMYYWAFGVLSN